MTAMALAAGGTVTPPGRVQARLEDHRHPGSPAARHPDDVTWA
jgi:hypothetical protein